MLNNVYFKGENEELLPVNIKVILKLKFKPKKCPHPPDFFHSLFVLELTLLL
jgi:hypothetical protein